MLSKLYKCAGINVYEYFTNIRFTNDAGEIVFTVKAGEEKPLTIGKQYSIIVMNDKGEDE